MITLDATKLLSALRRASIAVEQFGAAIRAAGYERPISTTFMRFETFEDYAEYLAKRKSNP